MNLYIMRKHYIPLGMIQRILAKNLVLIMLPELTTDLQQTQRQEQTQ